MREQYYGGLYDAYEDVCEFHIACDQPCYFHVKHPGYHPLVLRWRLIDEEVNRELLPALEALSNESPRVWTDYEEEMVAVADGIADAIYVLLGTAAVLGLPMAEIWRRVHESNMAKVKDGVLRREDGKILKPEGWQPPDVAGAIREAMEK